MTETSATSDAEAPERIPLSQAASRLGVSRTTVNRWVKEGTLSVTVNSDGQKTVDVAELARVLPEHANKPAKDEIEIQPQYSKLQQLQQDILLAYYELDSTREALKISQERLAEAKKREDRLLGIVESQSKLPPHKPARFRDIHVAWMSAAAGVAVASIIALVITHWS